jgi:phosphatidate phosphatase PAH1
LDQQRGKHSLHFFVNGPRFKVDGNIFQWDKEKLVIAPFLTDAEYVSLTFGATVY